MHVRTTLIATPRRNSKFLWTALHKNKKDSCKLPYIYKKHILKQSRDITLPLSRNQTDKANKHQVVTPSVLDIYVLDSDGRAKILLTFATHAPPSSKVTITTTSTNAVVTINKHANNKSTNCRPHIRSNGKTRKRQIPGSLVVPQSVAPWHEAVHQSVPTGCFKNKNCATRISQQKTPNLTNTWQNHPITPTPMECTL